jgi:hypothetical protein
MHRHLDQNVYLPPSSPLLALNHPPKSPRLHLARRLHPARRWPTSLVSSRSHTSISLLQCASCLTPPLSPTLCLASPLPSGLSAGLSLLTPLANFRCPAVFLTLSHRLQEHSSRPLVPRSSRVHVSLPIGTVPLVLPPYPLSSMLSRLTLSNTSRASLLLLFANTLLSRSPLLLVI